MDRLLQWSEYIPFLSLIVGSKMSHAAWMRIIEALIIAAGAAVGSSWMTIQVTTKVTEKEVQHLQTSITELKQHLALMNGLYIEHLREHANAHK